MKTKAYSLFAFAALNFLLLFFSSCQQPKEDVIANNFSFATKQLTYAFTCIDEALANEPQESRENRKRKGWGDLTNPRNIEPDGSLHLVPSRDWTSGFFPGELWYMYEYTKDEFWKEKAQKHSAMIEREKLNGGTHDMGFKMYCSYGNGYRLTQDENYKSILLQSAETLITRYKPTIGAIRSWDHSRAKWDCPVIIDNMMNLELLFWAFRQTSDSVYYNIAVNHAKTTMKNHFREDYSSYHVIDYDTISGKVLKKNTHQGYAHESAWARGQAWALYGYTMCYRETGLPEFLKQAQHVENYIFTHPNMPSDLIPYWDFDAPEIPNEPRDVSAASCMASALYELSLYDASKSEDYKGKADMILQNLTHGYRAALDKDKGFLLLHSTGSKPGNFEIDVPIVYADYYFLEALLRKQKLETKGKLF